MDIGSLFETILGTILNYKRDPYVLLTVAHMGLDGLYIGLKNWIGLWGTVHFTT